MNDNDYVQDRLESANMTHKQAHDMAEKLAKRLNLPFGVCKVPNVHKYWVTKYRNEYMMYYFEKGKMVELT